MRVVIRIALAAGGIAAFFLLLVDLPSAESAPTCAGTLDIAVHGEHIVADYVTGIGHGDMDWPPPGGLVGGTTGANGGAAVRGGPGPGFHFPNEIAPGASFCLPQSNSPGAHF